MFTYIKKNVSMYSQISRLNSDILMNKYMKNKQYITLDMSISDSHKSKRQEM